MPLDEHERSKLSVHAADYIENLEMVVRDFLALERKAAPTMDGKRRDWAYIRPGASLAATIDNARKVLGEL